MAFNEWGWKAFKFIRIKWIQQKICNKKIGLMKM